MTKKCKPNTDIPDYLMNIQGSDQMFQMDLFIFPTNKFLFGKENRPAHGEIEIGLLLFVLNEIRVT